MITAVELVRIYWRMYLKEDIQLKGENRGYGLNAVDTIVKKYKWFNRCGKRSRQNKIYNRDTNRGGIISESTNNRRRSNGSDDTYGVF